MWRSGHPCREFAGSPSIACLRISWTQLLQSTQDGPRAHGCEVGGWAYSSGLRSRPRFCIGVSKFSFVSPLRHISRGKSFAFLGFLLQWRVLCDPPLPTESVVLEALEPFPCPCTLRQEPSAHEEPVLQVGEAKSRPVPSRVFLASILMLLSPLSRASECVREGLSSETRRSPGISPGPANRQGDLQSYPVDVSSAS